MGRVYALYGGGTAQLRSQLIGSATCVVVVFGFSLLLMFAIRSLKGTWNLRLQEEGELEGLDIHEHGTPAYHMEFGQGVSYTTLLGSGRGLPGSGVPSAAPVSADKEPV